MAAKDSKPAFFATPAAFRAWLEKHHETQSELLVGFYKKDSGRPSMTWPESVDEALCFGWIDGVRKRVDDEAYTIRFTPRKKTSTWSAVNMRRIEALLVEKRVRPAGRAAYEHRSEAKSGIYAYEQRENAALSEEQQNEFRRHKTAWKFFESQPPSYRKVVTWWVISAKQEATRARRLAQLIEYSKKGERLPQYG
jgi:uncharacterized protein YdeI (YjbR/CyaY-like superfamily)